MKKLFFVFALFLTPFFSMAQAADTTTLKKVGDDAPGFELNIAKDKTAKLSDYRGKVVLLNFFATWCPPCREELPRVQKEIWEKYKDNPKFALFALDREEGWAKTLPFKEKNKYTFSMLPDEGRKVYKLYASQYIPRNVLIDEDGKIIYQSIGYSEKDFQELLDLLAKKLN